MDNAVRLTTPQVMVENVLQLISLPEIYLRLQQTIDDPLHTRGQLAEIVAYDPALSARILRIANSSYYSFPREIETVVSAVGIIGELDLRNLVLATTVVGSMNALDYKGVNIGDFWLHSLRCALSARLIAKSLDGYNPETLFLAGILHDIGILVIYQQDPTLAAAVARQIDEQHQLRDQAEREILGFDHAEVGALLLEAWGLSSELTELTRCHHQYQLAQRDRTAAIILALAGMLADAGSASLDKTDIRLVSMREVLGITEDNLEEILETGEQQCEEVKNIILG
ncbi:MAG: HDOD domain-containing protein [Gammaproteobacteria bacterium]|nr:HDOD domain-containing protein [Gammaproteobacteria bacterium]